MLNFFLWFGPIKLLPALTFSVLFSSFRKDVDSRTVVERIQRRREYHNYVERRRRDTINNTILALSEVVPDAIQPGQKPHKGKILKATLDYIMQLQAENDAFRQQFGDGCLHVSPGPGAMLVEPQSPPVMPLSAMPAPPPPQAMMGMPNAAASASSSRSSTPTPVMSPAPPALAPMAPIAPNVALDARPALPALAPRPPVCPPLMWDAEKRCRNTCHY
ncbi:hypothetical protein BC940DRAFT_20943 [Gongronella butleri]|nr:hypothetical protein BC940DRAFT_20943 [Gongronella butleri]